MHLIVHLIFQIKFFFFFNDTATTEIYTLSLHDALPISGIEARDSAFVIKTKTGLELKTDGVVAGIGIGPDVALAQSAGLKIDNGIVVDEYLKTSHPDIYAAGDVANFQNPALGKRIRVEHEDNANTMGKIAGKNMAGAGLPYDHLPFFYSDLFE